MAHLSYEESIKKVINRATENILIVMKEFDFNVEDKVAETVETTSIFSSKFNSLRAWTVPR